MLAAVTFLFIIHKLAAIGVNIVKIIIVNCLTINLIFNFTNKYINIEITNAVVIALPVYYFQDYCQVFRNLMLLLEHELNYYS